MRIFYEMIRNYGNCYEKSGHNSFWWLNGLYVSANSSPCDLAFNGIVLPQLFKSHFPLDNIYGLKDEKSIAKKKNQNNNEKNTENSKGQTINKVRDKIIWIEKRGIEKKTNNKKNY